MTTTFHTIRSLFDVYDNQGFSDDDLAMLKERFGFIPKVLYDYYAQLGKVHALNHTQDVLLAPHQMRWSKCQKYLIFYVENQQACVWGIQKQDLNQDNPPVYISYDEKEWQKESDTLSNFLTAMAQLQGVFSLNNELEEFIWFDNDKELAILQSYFKQKSFGFLVWCGGIDFYGDDDNEVLAVFNNEYFTYACKNQERFLQMSEILDILGKS